jgi:hypothetical protein
MSPSPFHLVYATELHRDRAKPDRRRAPNAHGRRFRIRPRRRFVPRLAW